jgi:outer membrane receptor protein involved in Fe transport
MFNHLIIKKFRIFCCFILGATALLGQPDSTLLLKPERLGVKDIININLDQNKNKAISATRSLTDLDQLPFDVWVITADDILRYGFVTLADVLKAAPGIRVSQPGNAAEGETFLMRGLSGNQYVKIMINDVPIKPAVCGGMPIGAQLPIRQAERIEVFYGPASAIYGNDACAGVVNIILKETERPVFTQADLGFGRNGYNSLDLMFGGKLGKDKKIFRYSIYGSSTIREDTDLFYDDNLFKPENYLPFGLDSSLYLNNENYRRSETNPALPKLAPIIHQSRLFGINLTWRGIHFTYHRMDRVDYGALGINPLAQSWSNPSDRLSERTETFTLGFNRQRKRWTSHTNISAELYKIDNNSTNTFIFDRLSSVNYLGALPSLNNDTARLFFRRLMFDQYAADERYSSARSLDARIETRLNAKLARHLFLEAGAQWNLGTGSPLTTHSDLPVETPLFSQSIDQPIRPYAPYAGVFFENIFFGQLEWRSNKLSMIGGAAFDTYFSPGSKSLLAPRLAALYRIDSAWSVYGNYALGFRRPSLFNIGNTVTYSLPINYIFAGDNFFEPNNNWFRKTETVTAYEAGVRYRNGDFRGQISGYVQQTNNLLRNNSIEYTTSAQTGDPLLTYGYNNTPGRSSQLYGAQGLFVLERADFDFKSVKKKAIITSRTEFYIQYARGKEWLSDGTKYTDIFNMPRWTTQFRSSWRTGKVQLMFASNRQTSVLSKAVTYKTMFQRSTITERYPTFRTWDMMVRTYLDKHFVVYFLLQNMFNRQYAGLDATGTPDDLLYNPQQGRIWRLGVNYNMN